MPPMGGVTLLGGQQSLPEGTGLSSWLEGGTGMNAESVNPGRCPLGMVGSGAAAHFVESCVQECWGQEAAGVK